MPREIVHEAFEHLETAQNSTNYRQGAVLSGQEDGARVVYWRARPAAFDPTGNVLSRHARLVGQNRDRSESSTPFNLV